MNRGRKCFAVLLAVVLMCSVVSPAMAMEVTGTAVRTDYSELQMLLGMANGLNSYDFTAESWKTLKDAVTVGNQYYKGRYGQLAVDEAVAEIERAILNLVKMDYSKLEAALAVVYTKIDENPELHDVWSRLDAAVAEARPLLASGDQGAVDAATEKLNALMAELTEFVQTEAEPEVVVQEVQVEVLPTDDYCNIPMHRTWPVLFAVSAAMNVGLIAGLIYIIMKKRQVYDNTPLVSYDIDDDMDF